MGRVRGSDYLVMDLVVVHGTDITRNGCLHCVDVHLKEIKSMREITIIFVILILALWAWKGGKS